MLIDFQEIAKQWHPTKNGSATPEHVTAGSNARYWWKCDKGPDHEWLATVANRTINKSGCPCCDDLEQDLMAVMTEMNLAADIEHVTDPAEIGDFAVTGTPALVINGKVKAVGAMPKKTQLQALLSDAAAKH